MNLKWITTTALILSLSTASIAYAQSDNSAKTGWMAKRQQRQEALAQLPPDKAKMYKDAVKQAREKNRPLHDQVEKLHQDIGAVMTAGTFDKQAYLTKNAEMEMVYTQMRTNMVEAIASVAMQFTPDERKILEKLRPVSAKREENTSPSQAPVAK